MKLNVPIAIIDELSDSEVRSQALLDLASGEIREVVYQGYDVAALGPPAAHDDYEFSSGLLAHDGKEVEFRVEADAQSGAYSITANELLELKKRAARLFGELG